MDKVLLDKIADLSGVDPLEESVKRIMLGIGEKNIGKIVDAIKSSEDGEEIEEVIIYAANKPIPGKPVNDLETAIKMIGLYRLSDIIRGIKKTLFKRREPVF